VKTRRTSLALRTWAALAAAFAMALGPSGGAYAQFQEFQVKAVYLYKFAPFVDWPANAFPSPASPLVLCVAGEDPFGPMLDRAVAGQKIGTHPIQVRRLGRAEKPAGCHILYLGGSKAEAIADALAGVRGAPVLTVTDGAVAGDDRGVIHFVVKDRTIRFEIDDSAAAKNGLTISSKLLSLAVAVKGRS
jgi:hypothetical protein